MSLTPLIERPWLHPRVDYATSHGLPSHWCQLPELLRLRRRWLHWLQGKPGGQWLLHQPDPLEFTAALLALWDSGRVAVLPADDRPETLQSIAAELNGQLPTSLPPGTEHEPASLPPLGPQDVALTLYTSGSTGQPLRLSKRFDQLDSELAVHAQLWPLTGAAVIAQVSHQHIYGLLAGVLHPLCAGVPFCGRDALYPEVLAARLAEAREAPLTAVVVSSPAPLSRLPEHIDWAAAGAPRRVFSSGAPLQLEHAEQAEALLQTPVTEIYGSTETGGIAWRQQSRNAVWQALPGVDWQIEEGALVLRSSFLEQPQLAWRQADRVAAQGQGFVLLGRGDRVAKVAGKRVSLEQIEQRLLQVPEVTAVRCVDPGRADGRLGLVVALRAEALPQEHSARRALTERLRARLAEQLERVALPRYWRFVEQLPCNAQGKLDRALIARLFADLDDERLPRWLGEQWQDTEHCRHSFEVPERLIYLRGHFDGFALVPGVVMIQWALQIAEQSFGPLGQFQRLERLKFQTMLRPGMRFQLTLARKPDAVTFSLDSSAGRHCTATARFQPDAGLQT
ncbi:MAG: AMP-binding protein [Halopseudomonas sp.]|uniref:AMP-binding protein n=1 Tax=Halopseudomonas sp. TaxID=2901191 RepID=UPI0030038E76